MKKSVVTIAILILILGVVVSFLISETRLEEDMIDEWNPITPSTLYPHCNEASNEFNHTGYRFIDRAEGNPNNERFRQLFEQGEISELFLELNVTASGLVRVIIGKLSPNTTIFKTYFSRTIFDETGTYITKRVEINVDTVSKRADADHLEIENEETNTVNVSGNIKLKAKMPKLFYPLYGFGILMCLLGFSLVVYGILAKPKRKWR